MRDGQGVASSGSPTRLPELHTRTRQFALAIIRLYAVLPKTTVAQVIGKQVLRSGTSVGAHCREAHRARSDAEFVSKIELGLQEFEETTYWLEILSDAKVIATDRIAALAKEANELTAMIVTAAKRVKHRTAGTATRG